MEAKFIKRPSTVRFVVYFVIQVELLRSTAAVLIENFSHGRILPVVCYYEYKGADLRPHPMDYKMRDVPGDLCSHVNLAFIELNETDWTFKRDPRVNFENVTQLKRTFPRLKIFLSIGGWRNQPGVISNMVSMTSHREQFVRNAVQTLVDGGFDGLDIFWLYPTREGGRKTDKVNFVRLLKELNSAFRKHSLLLTVGVSMNKGILDDGYNISEIDRCVDWMNVVGYDLRGEWNKRTDIHSPLHPRSIDGSEVSEFNVEQGLRALLDRGASKRKLVLGVAFYGRVYRLAGRNNTGLHAPIDLHRTPKEGAFLKSDKVYAYFEVCLNFKNSSSWNRSFDEEGMCPYATNGEDWVGYEDAESTARKADFVSKEGYAGVMVLSCDMDDFVGICGTKDVLLKTINDRLPRLPPFVS
ncbi:endochitinase-like isoform X1 [Haemaphysalis longicornis]